MVIGPYDGGGVDRTVGDANAFNWNLQKKRAAVLLSLGSIGFQGGMEGFQQFAIGKADINMEGVAAVCIGGELLVTG